MPSTLAFANLTPRQTSSIPWGWVNNEIDGRLWTIAHPGCINMPSLVDYFDWSTYLVEDVAPGLRLGTRNMKSIFTTAARFLGYEPLLRDMPSLHRITDGFLEWNKRLLSTWRGQLGYFLVGDDIASTSGLIMSPTDLKEWLAPQYKRLIELALYYGLQPWFHSDGDIYEALSIIKEVGFVGVVYEPVGDMKEAGGGGSWGDLLLVINDVPSRPNPLATNEVVDEG